MHAMTPAVVVGANLNGLGVIRSLRRANVPVYVVDASRQRPAMWANGCRPVIVDALHGRALIHGLLDLGRRIGERAVLFLTDELSVQTVSQFREELSEAYRFRLPLHPMVTALSDKSTFQQLAERNGYPVPRSAVLASMSDFVKLHELSFPVIIKPIEKHRIHAGAIEYLHRARTLQEAESFCARVLPEAGGLIVHEWISGHDSSLYFTLFYRGSDDMVATFTGRKLACDPPAVGGSGICVAAPDVSGMLEPLASAFADTVGFEGMGVIEFKWDGMRKRFIMVESTVGRADWQGEIATLCGINIPVRAYRHELGLPRLGTGRPRTDVAWRASGSQRWPRNHPRGNVRIVDGFWRLADPAPAVIHYAFASTSRYLRGSPRDPQRGSLGTPIAAERASQE
jgi:predicted ATP-grasp superfamily ATP-dependent carboligase